MMLSIFSNGETIETVRTEKFYFEKVGLRILI